MWEPESWPLPGTQAQRGNPGCPSGDSCKMKMLRGQRSTRRLTAGTELAPKLQSKLFLDPGSLSALLEILPLKRVFPILF